MPLENIMNMDALILSSSGILVFIGLSLLILGLKRLGQGKFTRAGLQTLSGTSLFFAGLLLISVSMNLYSYQRLSFEQAIAELSFEQLDKQRFQASFSLLNTDKADKFLLHGDEWQVDARVIKWHGLAQLLGLNAQYRLERISGRYRNIEQEQNHKRTVYALGPDDRIDYWKLMHDYKKWLPWVDAYYGSATYLPMSDNTSYILSLTQTGLIARAKDHNTTEIIKSW